MEGRAQAGDVRVDMRDIPLSVIIEWDTLNWAKALQYWETVLPQSLLGWRALEVGARNGGLSLYLARKGCQVVCTDLGGPTPQARERHRHYGVRDRVEYAAIDVRDIPFSDNTFDVVIFKSILGDVGWDGNRNRQQEAIDEMYRVLKRDGILLFAENLRGSALHAFLRRKFVPWGTHWRYITVDEMRQFTEQFSLFSCRTYGFWGAFGRSEVQRRLLHMIDVIMDPLLPESAKYIAFGFARK